MIARLLAPLLGILLVGCGAHGAVSQLPDSGIEGTVLVGPTCPVERAGSPCPDRPLATNLEVVRPGVVVQTRSASDGRFRISLPAGTYTIRSHDTGPPTLQPVEVTVPPHAFTSVTLTFDSGIR
jgi:hypothetical protein